MASSSKSASTAPKVSSKIPTPADYDQIVLVLQGGGSLGGYQAGVYDSMPRGIDPIGLPALRAAGPIRDQEMLDKGKPDLVVAFLGNRGTADMVRRAREAGVPVRRPGLEVTRLA